MEKIEDLKLFLRRLSVFQFSFCKHGDLSCPAMFTSLLNILLDVIILLKAVTSYIVTVFRLKNSVTLKLGRKLLPTCASKANPAEGSDGKKGKAAQGPPFLTILAGFLVFFVLCWIIGSILLWLIGLFVRAPPSK